MANIRTVFPAIKLNDGTSMPMLGYGTGTAWYKNGEESKIDQAIIDAVKIAIKLEYTHLDGAQVYKTEPELGRGIKESGVARDKLYIVTKLSNENAAADPEAALRESLKKLQVDQVDLYLIHSPFWATSDADLQRAWAAMEATQAAGLTKSIGVSNFYPSHLSAILQTAKVPPVCNQIEFHPYLQHTASGLLDLHKQHNIATVAYSPLTPVTQAPGGPVDDFLAALAKKYAVGPGEVLLRWCVDQDIVPVTTSGKEQRLSDYLRAATFKLTPKEIQSINELGSQKHYRGFWNKYFPEEK